MKIGNIDIVNPIHGDKTVRKVFIGSDLVWTTNKSGVFSLRTVDPNFTGKCIQVRRDSDNSTLDIGFLSGVLDTSSLTTFCSGANGFVTVWYNQGFGLDVTQSTASRQPKIYDSSTGVETENGKPCLLFDGVDDTLVTFNIFGSIDDCISVFTVVNGNTGFFPSILTKSYDENGAYALGFESATGYLNGWIEKDSFRDVKPDVSGSQILISNINKTGTNNIKYYVDSIFYSEYTTTQDLTGSNQKEFRIGSNSLDNNYYWNGTIQEILMFDNDQTANKTTIETDINNFYTIY